MKIWSVRASLVAGVLTASGLPALAAEPPTTMIVFDGSGSMWGRFAGDAAGKGGESKFVVAREAIKRALPSLSKETRFGLAAFGHRRKGDCSDAEVMLAPDALEPARIAAPLDKLNPKGKGPLVKAMREAAGAISKSSGAATLVLIHDDFDNCNQDPCAAVDELVAAQPNLTIHVVGIGLAKPDSERMACVSRATRGKHYDAQDAAAVGSAIEDALRLASLDGKPPAVPTLTRAPVVVARPVTPIEETGPPGLKLSATLGVGGPAIVLPLNWRVSRDAEQIANQLSAGLELDVAPGSYTVEVRRGLVSATQTVEVKAKGFTRVAIALQAGALKMAASLQRGTEPLDAALFSVSEVAMGSGTSGSGRTVWTGNTDASPVLLSPGTWKISAQIDRAKVERQVIVKAGEMVDVTLPLGAGRLRVKATDREGGAALDRIIFRVTEDDPEAADGRREVARSAAISPDFILPAGTYYLSARLGHAEVRERVLLNAGDELSRALVLGLGRLNLQSRWQVTGGPVTETVSYRVERLDGPRTGGKSEIAKTTRPEPSLELAPGRYRIESWLGAHNSKVTRDIELKAGGVQTLNLLHAAASVQLKLSSAAARLMTGEVLWDVRDSSGRRVWQTTQVEPRAFLAAGRYKISVEGRERRAESEIDLRAGETRVVEMVVE